MIENKSLLIVPFFLLIVAILGGVYWFNSESEELTYEKVEGMLGDYSSQIYTKVTHEDFRMTQDDFLNLFDIPMEQREIHTFDFYQLTYGKFDELHAIGITKGEACFNVAITNASTKIGTYSQASFLGFFQFEQLSVGDTHTCTGVDCSSCSFTRGENGGITGCECNTPVSFDSKCNHTVVTQE